MVKVETSPEYNPNEDLLVDQYSNNEYIDREVEMPAIVQTQKTMDPNLQIFEVKCNPELNFAYVDVKNTDKTPDIISEDEWNKNQASNGKKIGKCCNESLCMKVLTAVILLLSILLVIIIVKIAKLQALIDSTPEDERI